MVNVFDRGAGLCKIGGVGGLGEVGWRDLTG